MPKEDYSKPVAYDTQGRPLYLHPSDIKKTDESEVTTRDEVAVVQVTRSADPVAVEVSPEMARRNKESQRKYPFLNLTDGEHVILEVKRHPIGIICIWLVTIISILGVLAGWWVMLAHPGSALPYIAPEGASSVSMFAVALAILFALFGWVAQVIFLGNKFFLTNESVIQEIQTALLAQKEQTINLENIKDASFSQRGIVATLFDYGSLRLSTEGDEQEYYFTLVNKPKEQIAIVNNVIEAVKYGRPVDEAIDHLARH